MSYFVKATIAMHSMMAKKRTADVDMESDEYYESSEEVGDVIMTADHKVSGDELIGYCEPSTLL